MSMFLLYKVVILIDAEKSEIKNSFINFVKLNRQE